MHGRGKLLLFVAHTTWEENKEKKYTTLGESSVLSPEMPVFAMRTKSDINIWRWTIYEEEIAK